MQQEQQTIAQKFLKVNQNLIKSQDIVDELALIVKIVLSRAFFTQEGDSSVQGIQRSFQDFLKRYEIKEQIEIEAELFNFFKFHHILIADENSEILVFLDKYTDLILTDLLLEKSIVFIDDNQMIEILKLKDSNMENLKKVLLCSAQQPNFLIDKAIDEEIKSLEESTKNTLLEEGLKENLKEIKENTLHFDYQSLNETEKNSMIKVHEQLRSKIVTKFTYLNYLNNMNMKFIIAQSVCFLIFDEIWQGSFTNQDLVESFFQFMVNKYFSPIEKVYEVSIIQEEDIQVDVFKQNIIYHYKQIGIVITEREEKTVEPIIQPQINNDEFNEQDQNLEEEYYYEDDQTEYQGSAEQVEQQQVQNIIPLDGIAYLKLDKMESVNQSKDSPQNDGSTPITFQNINSISTKGSISFEEYGGSAPILNRQSSRQIPEKLSSKFQNLLIPIINIQPSLSIKDTEILFNQKLQTLQFQDQTDVIFQSQIQKQTDYTWRLFNEAELEKKSYKNFQFFYSYNGLRILNYLEKVETLDYNQITTEIGQKITKILEKLTPIGNKEISEQDMTNYNKIYSDIAECQDILNAQLVKQISLIQDIENFEFDLEQRIKKTVNHCPKHKSGFDNSRKLPMIYSCGHTICYQCSIKFNNQVQKNLPNNSKTCPCGCPIPSNRLKIHFHNNHLLLLFQLNQIFSLIPTNEIKAELENKQMFEEYYVGDYQQEHEPANYNNTSSYLQYNHMENIAPLPKQENKSGDQLIEAIQSSNSSQQYTEDELAILAIQIRQFLRNDFNEINGYCNPSRKQDLLTLIMILNNEM